jgi:predicted ester cyclase
MIYHWKEDRIIEQWDYTDMLGLMQQLGLVPAAA